MYVCRLYKLPTNAGLHFHTMYFGFVDNFPLAIKTEDVISNTASSTRLHLMFVSEKLLTSKSPAIVQFTMREHSQQSTFSCIHISNYSNTEK